MRWRFRPLGVAVLTIAAWFLGSCSFDYGIASDEEETRNPDMSMIDLEYVRVRNGEPLVRVQADRADNYEQDQSMVLDRLRFEQYAPRGGKVESSGSAGEAEVNLESGDVDLSGGVQIAVDSEDLTIETQKLSWRDEQKELLGGEDVPVLLKRSDGALMEGVGFSADARSHSWTFTGAVSGTYVEKDDDEKSVSEETSPENPE